MSPAIWLWLMLRCYLRRLQVQCMMPFLTLGTCIEPFRTAIASGCKTLLFNRVQVQKQFAQDTMMLCSLMLRMIARLA